MKFAVLLSLLVQAVTSRASCVETDLACAVWRHPLIQSYFEDYWTTPNYKEEVNKVWQAGVTVSNPLHSMAAIYGLELDPYFLDGDLLEPDGFADCSIHPLIEQSQWITNDPHWNAKYDDMKPALCLASKFLEEDTMLDWFVHVENGEPTTRAGIQFLESAGPPTQELLDRAKHGLVELATTLRFTWFDSELLSTADAFNAPLTLFLELIGTEVSLPTSIKDLGLQVIGCSLKKLPAPQKDNLSNQLHFAKAILHEIAHAWNRKHHGDIEIRAYFDDIFPESGFSYEAKAFGGILSCVPQRDGLCHALNFASLRHSYPTRVPLHVYVQKKWIQQWFRTETWDNIAEKKLTGQLTLSPEVFSFSQYVPNHGLVQHLSSIHSAPWNQSSTKLTHDELMAWYDPVWKQDAEIAHRDGHLPEEYYAVSEAYGHLFSPGLEWPRVDERTRVEETWFQYLATLALSMVLSILTTALLTKIGVL